MWPIPVQETLPKITVSKMRAVLRKYPVKKSGGYDGWILRDLCALPDEILQHLLNWLHMVEQEGVLAITYSCQPDGLVTQTRWREKDSC